MSHSYASSELPWSARPKPESAGPPRTFMGYHRADGRVGTRNYWLVILLALPENEPVALLQEAFQTVLGYQSSNTYERHLRDLREQYRAGSYFDTTSSVLPRPAYKPIFAHIDGIQFLLPPSGTELSNPAGQNWLDVLAGYCVHPNVGGITVVSRDERTGGQSASALLRQLVDQRTPTFAKPLLILDQAAYPTERAWLTAVTHDTFRAMTVLNKQTRLPSPLAHLIIGAQYEKTNGAVENAVVTHYLTSVVRIGATVFLFDAGSVAKIDTQLQQPATSIQEPSGLRIEAVELPVKVTEVTTALAVAGCTLHVSEPGRALSGTDVITPILTFPADTDQPLLNGLIQLASGKL